MTTIRKRSPHDPAPDRNGIVVGALARRAFLPCLILAVLVVIVGGLLQVRLDTTVRSFVPDGDQAYAATEAKAKAFGDDPILVVAQTKQPQDIGRNGKLLLQFVRLEGQLSHLPNVQSVYGPGTALNQIAIAAQDFLAEISGRRDAIQEQARLQAKRGGVSAAAANAAANRAVEAFDIRYGALLVEAMPAGLPTLSNQAFVATVLYDKNQKIRQQWRSIIPNDTAVVVLIRPRAGLDQTTSAAVVHNVERVVRSSGLDVRNTTITGVPVVTSALSDTAQREFPLISTAAVVVVGLVFLFAPWTRRRKTRLAPLAVSLLGSLTTVALFGWSHQTLSLGVVAFLPILMGIGSDFPYYLLTHRLNRPVIVASLGAACGFATLALSSLPFVRELGIALTLGILLTMVYAVVTRRFTRPSVPANIETHQPSQARADHGRRAFAVLGVSVVIAGLGWAMLPDLQIDARPEQIASGLHQLTDAERVEAQIGSSGEIDVMLTGTNALSPAALAWSRQAESNILNRHGDELRAIVTPSELFAFLGKTPTTEEVEAGLSLMPSYLTKVVVKPDQSASLMTFGVRLNDLAGQGSLVRDISSALPPTPPGLTANVVGLPVLTTRAVSLASQDRIVLNLAGLLGASLVVGIGLGARSALKVLATGLLATGCLFAVVALIAGSLNPLTVAIGSLVTATATEFSVLFDAVPGDRARRFKVVGTAAVAGIAGFLTLTVSQLSILQDFGLLLAGGVLISLFAAVVVGSLPAWRVPGRGQAASGGDTVASELRKGALV